MGIFNKLGSKNVDKIVDGAVKGVDKLFFTNEEKAEFNKSMADAVVEYAQSTMGENTIRSITRRFVAFAIMGTYLLLILSAGAVYLVDENYSTFLFDLAKSQDSLAIMVAVFYFGGYYANKFIGSNRKKKVA